MGNTDSNEWNAARSSEEDSARRRRENTVTAAGAAKAVAAVAAAGWAVTKLLSSSASEDEKTNDKGKLMVAAGSSSGYPSGSFSGYPTNKFEGYLPDEKTNERGKMMEATGGKLKMNIGASLSDDRSRAGFGGVIHDEGGRWIMGFYGRISTRDCTPEQAAIWGIYNGLKIIQGEKFRQLEIESVSEPAVILLRDKTRRKSRIDDIVEECKGLLLSTGCKVNYTDRKGIADALAELGRDQVTDLSLLDVDARSASSARRQRGNTATVVGAVTTVAAVVAAGRWKFQWLPLEVSVATPRTFEGYLRDEKTNDKGKLIVAAGGKLKMNTGASLSDDRSRAGFGGVIRDEGGRWIMGFYGRISMRDCTPEQAVIWGIYNGLKIIQGEKFRQVEIESVSEPAVIHLRDKTRRKSRIDDIVEECKRMLLSTGCKLNYTDRKGIADALAELGRDQVTDLVLVMFIRDVRFEKWYVSVRYM
ncbi:hypothetical protein RHSIM_Rhsim09G0125500 [Rhododendron simsii]|uniref:RNase H type-1 domain-containing protein n=1 Tax=Rhododendron simsii TaxID=118357 RepID=A0A834LEI3_RHOSS|nr:hypothetical protein RHSIM_Rhsim09G0125500 [Rhododendron simsii]